MGATGQTIYLLVLSVVAAYLIFAYGRLTSDAAVTAVQADSFSPSCGHAAAQTPSFKAANLNDSYVTMTTCTKTVRANTLPKMEAGADFGIA